MPAVLYVAVIGPTDPGAESGKDGVERAILAWNRDVGDRERLELRPLRWPRDTATSIQRGNDGELETLRQIVSRAKIVFAVFHSRLGSETARDGAVARDLRNWVHWLGQEQRSKLRIVASMRPGFELGQRLLDSCEIHSIGQTTYIRGLQKAAQADITEMYGQLGRSTLGNEALASLLLTLAMSYPYPLTVEDLSQRLGLSQIEIEDVVEHHRGLFICRNRQITVGERTTSPVVVVTLAHSVLAETVLALFQSGGGQPLSMRDPMLADKVKVESEFILIDHAARLEKRVSENSAVDDNKNPRS